MILKNAFTIHSVVGLISGLALLILPVQILSLFGIEISGADAILICRLFAAALLTYGLVSWLARDAGPSDARQAIVLGFFIPITIGFVIALVAQLTGVMNEFGWVIVAIYFLIALDYGYFYFTDYIKERNASKKSSKKSSKK